MKYEEALAKLGLNPDIRLRQIFDLGRLAALAELKVQPAPMQQEPIYMIAQAVEAEREACAKVCDDKHDTWRWDDEADSASGPRDCAAAIRARSGDQK